MKTTTRFTVIELLLGLYVATFLGAAVGMGAARPLRASRTQANETAAVANLRAHVAAQAIFHKGGYSLRAAQGQYIDEPVGLPANPQGYSQDNRMYAYPFSDLYNVRSTPAPESGPVALIPAAMARAINAQTAFQGYYYVQGNVREPSTNRFGLFATPAQYGVTGRNTFYIDTRGVVRAADMGRSITPEEAANIDPAKDGGWLDA